MAHLIYTTNTSLDGYIEDMDGKFDWTDPSDEVFQFITNLCNTSYPPRHFGVVFRV